MTVNCGRQVTSLRSQKDRTIQEFLEQRLEGMLIDTSFDFRTDTPPGKGKDPDKDSPTLRRYHKLLWSKALPDGALFDLNDAKPRVYLHHHSQLGEFWLSSDSVISTFTRWGFAKVHPELYTDEDNEAFVAIAYTIGGIPAEEPE